VFTKLRNGGSIDQNCIFIIAIIVFRRCWRCWRSLCFDLFGQWESGQLQGLIAFLFGVGGPYGLVRLQSWHTNLKDPELAAIDGRYPWLAIDKGRLHRLATGLIEHPNTPSQSGLSGERVRKQSDFHFRPRRAIPRKSAYACSTGLIQCADFRLDVANKMQNKLFESLIVANVAFFINSSL
jgi:hypothetical protein